MIRASTGDTAEGDRHVMSSAGPSTEADVVVIGAGSAGAALAARLSEDPKLSVAVIEAGIDDRSIWRRIPVGYFKMVGNARFDWKFQTEPEPHMDNRRIACPRGRVLGGTSAINGMLYVRGQAADYDQWARDGNEGWSWREVLPYFKRSMDQTRGASAVHGTGGPLTVSELEIDELSRAFIDSCLAAGLPYLDDFNAGSNEGAGPYQIATRGGERASTDRVYLREAMARPNLHVITGALTRRVLFDKTRACGVEYVRDGVVQTVRARHEVIVCAGAIQSPQILQLSGIGPAALLQAHGIAPLVSLPGVGRNLQDHLQARLFHRVNKPITGNDIWHSPWRRVREGLNYLLNRGGFLANGIFRAGAFYRSHPSVSRPDIQAHFGILSIDNPSVPPHPHSGMTLSVCLLRPESTGSIEIQSADPGVAPRIHANYLAAPADRIALIRAVRRIREIAALPPLASYSEGEFQPGPAAQSDEDILAFLRAKGTTIFHPAGTCKMGADPMGVVDDCLRVYGVEGLRVADTSIMPRVVSGNTNAPAIMIGEKAADLVRETLRH